MSGRHVQSATGGRVRFWLAGLAVALVAVIIAALAGPANASSKNVQAQLSLSGLASADNPVGGSQIGVHPGDQVTFAAAGVPTAGLDKLGLGDLAGGLLTSGASFQVTADFSGLPGGADNTVLVGNTQQTFEFPKAGSYDFTWTAQKVTLLGVVPIDLDGNELAQAGVTLNASNEYVGKIVVSANPPSGGLSLQLPSVTIAPSAPVVGQLPTVSIPGVSLPTVGVSVPDLNPSSAAAGSGTSGGAGAGSAGAAGATPTTAGPTYAPPGISVPQEVVGGLTGGGGGSGSGGSGGGGGFRFGVTGGGSSSQLSVDSTGSSGTASGSGAGSGSSTQGGSSGSNQTVDLASSSASPSGQLPVVLAILAVITLAMVAGIYARLYLLGRKTPTSG